MVAGGHTMSMPVCGCSHGVSPNPWLTYSEGQFIGALTMPPADAAHGMTVPRGHAASPPMRISCALSATSALPTDTTTAPTITPHAPHPTQEVRQQVRRPPLRF